jgi:hypothetical protein
MGLTFGRNIKVALGQEAVYNTYVSPVAHGIYVEPDGVDISPEKQIIELPVSRGVAMPNLADMAEGVKGWTGKLRFALSKEDMNWLILNLFGAVTTTLISGGFYTHVHLISNTTPKSLSVLYQHDLVGITTPFKREWQLSGGMIKSLKLIFELNKPVMCEIELVGGTFLLTYPVGTAPTYSVPATDKPYFYTFKNGLFTINDLTTWNRVELTFAPAIADGLEDSYEYGSDARKRLERAGEPAMLITGTAKRLLDEETNLAAWDALTTIGLVFLSGVIANPAYAFKIELTKLKLMTPPKRDKKGMGLFEETLSFKAFMESANTENRITINDTQATPVTQ